MPSYFIYDQRFGLQRAKIPKIAVFCEKRLSVITYESVKARHSFCQHRVSLVKPRRMDYKLTKGHVENGHNLIGETHVAYQSIRIVSLNTSIIFSSLWLVHIKSYCRKAAGDLSWPEMTSATWGGSLVTISRFSLSILPVTRCFSVSNVFCSKEAPFNLLLLTYNDGEVARSPCSYDEHLHFFWGEVTWREACSAGAS